MEKHRQAPAIMLQGELNYRLTFSGYVGIQHNLISFYICLELNNQQRKDTVSMSWGRSNEAHALEKYKEKEVNLMSGPSNLK